MVGLLLGLVTSLLGRHQLVVGDPVGLVVSFVLGLAVTHVYYLLQRGDAEKADAQARRRDSLLASATEHHSHGGSVNFERDQNDGTTLTGVTLSSTGAIESRTSARGVGATAEDDGVR